MSVLTPRRRRGVEYLDEPGVDPRVVTRSLADVALANRMFGGVRAVITELKPVLGELPRSATMLDVGSGMGDIPMRARVVTEETGRTLSTIALDASEALARVSASRTAAAVCGDALMLPFRDRSFDLVTCSQLLHHFPDAQARTLLRELDRVARVRVIVSELRRSWIAAAGIWLASWGLRFHPISRHDGVVSVLRGFTPEELTAAVASAVGREPVVMRRIGYRITATWRPEHSDVPAYAPPVRAIAGARAS